MRIEQRPVYIAKDGQEFNTEGDCLKHEFAADAMARWIAARKQAQWRLPDDVAETFLRSKFICETGTPEEQLVDGYQWIKIRLEYSLEKKPEYDDHICELLAEVDRRIAESKK